MEEILPINDSQPYISSFLFLKMDVKNKKYLTVDEIKK